MQSNVYHGNDQEIYDVAGTVVLRINVNPCKLKDANTKVTAG
jgi:hypothetical protein